MNTTAVDCTDTLTDVSPASACLCEVLGCEVSPPADKRRHGYLSATPITPGNHVRGNLAILLSRPGYQQARPCRERDWEKGLVYCVVL